METSLSRIGLPSLWATLVCWFLVTSVKVPVRHIPNISPQKASNSSAVGLCFPASSSPENSSSVCTTWSLPRTSSYQDMSNSFVGFHMPISYARKHLSAQRHASTDGTDMPEMAGCFDCDIFECRARLRFPRINARRRGEGSPP